MLACVPPKCRKVEERVIACLRSVGVEWTVALNFSLVHAPNESTTCAHSSLHSTLHSSSRTVKRTLRIGTAMGMQSSLISTFAALPRVGQCVDSSHNGSRNTRQASSNLFKGSILADLSPHNPSEHNKFNDVASGHPANGSSQMSDDSTQHGTAQRANFARSACKVVHQGLLVSTP
ncbi:hypothetical protein B0O80DRAFT_397227 [Mortierella sp. GBAus27b]|nr:hypothetical protein B0O80DRAFT_397227 [Mortierella sp. GBAus27b]